MRRILVLCCALFAQVGFQGTTLHADEAMGSPSKSLPIPGETFLVSERPAFLIPAAGLERQKPWVWYAPTLPGLPGNEERWMFARFLASGISVGGIDVGESYGSPAGRALFTAFYDEMTRRGYSPRPVLLGRSRGGLMALSWAAENPERVGAFAGIYPVCNVASYPGLAKAAPAYGLSASQLQDHLPEHNPVNRLSALANAQVPMFAIHGDVDTVVPLEQNSALMRERYAALGGAMQLLVPPGQGHNMWPGFFQCQELVDFVKQHAGPNFTLASPRDYEVVQRRTRTAGTMTIKGELAGLSTERAKHGLRIEGRLVTGGKPGKWRRIGFSSRTRFFSARWKIPAGGWYRLELRAQSNDETLAQTAVEHLGVGEIFVVAGQSNSANHGAEKQTTRTGLVSTFDGESWRLANDPQPGASGSGGSFMPPFGDAMAEKFQVPVGLVACGVGATSVREWLPAAARFPNPPTLTNNVRKIRDGVWESDGRIFASFVQRTRALGPRGFRAVLWHQGESDANQADPTRTLSGDVYRDCLKKLIRDSRRQIGWKAPWFVAQASYHTPGDEGSEEIRAAQASLWQGSALEGPDTDAIKGQYREDQGRGVHFSGPGLREHARHWYEKVAPWLEKNLR